MSRKINPKTYISDYRLKTLYMKTGIKVIWTCFAGRQRYLEILLRYIRYFLSKGLIHECHLWNYTRNPQDEDWLRQEFSNDSKPIEYGL